MLIAETVYASCLAVVTTPDRTSARCYAPPFAPRGRTRPRATAVVQRVRCSQGGRQRGRGAAMAARGETDKAIKDALRAARLRKTRAFRRRRRTGVQMPSTHHEAELREAG